jgi:4-hydroxybenzoate polyprenyltransferase
MWQMSRISLNDTAVLLRLFRSNRDAGLLPVLFFACALVV